MALLLDVVSLALIFTGAFFFVAGTAGLVRFPDVFTSLHALSKADNLGLGLVIFGILPHMESTTDALKLLVIWFVAMVSASTNCHLIARKALRTGMRPWQ